MPRAVVIWLVGAMPLPKLRQLLHTDAVLPACIDMARAAHADAEAPGRRRRPPGWAPAPPLPTVR